MLALARKELSAGSFRLFIGKKPLLPQTIEDLSTKVTWEELKEDFTDEWGVEYSKDRRKLLKAPQGLNGTYSIRKGTACGAADKPEEKPAACGTACGASDK